MQKIIAIVAAIALHPGNVAAEQLFNFNSAERPMVAETSTSAQPVSSFRRSSGRTWGGVGLMAAGVLVVLTGQSCRTVGEFAAFELPSLDVQLTGRSPVLSESCELTDFTITGNVGADSLNRSASEYDLNSLQRSIRSQIEADVYGEPFLKPSNLYSGVAMMGVGALLATVWASVSEDPLLDVAVAPGHIQVGKTFGF